MESQIGLLNMFMYLNEDVFNWGKCRAQIYCKGMHEYGFDRITKST